MIPKKGNVYVFFDDNKISPSRIDLVEITEVIKFDETDKNIIKKWKENISLKLFKNKTDYFLKGKLFTETKYGYIELIFAETKNNKWFSFNNYLYDGVLDIDGSLYKKYLERINN